MSHTPGRGAPAPEITSHAPVVLGGDRVRSLEEYVARGGGEGLRVARRIGPWRTADEVTLAGLRGRGGGGFRTGRKWLAVLDNASDGERTFVVGNGAEGEPGTFKDRAILRHNPYQVIEGLAIAALTVGASRAFLATKSSFTLEVGILRRALAEMRAAGLAGDASIRLVRGPDSYLFGEEKALLEVIEGEEPLPRRDPPYVHGLFASGPQMGWSARDGVDAGGEAVNPTIVNKVETLATVPHVLAHGAEWFRALGTWDSPGTMVFAVVGDVVRPGYGELEFGTPLRSVIEQVGGGPRPGRRIKAVFSGVASGVITADKLDVPATYEDLAAIGSALGSAGFIVYDDTTDMVSLARTFAGSGTVRAMRRVQAPQWHTQRPPCPAGTQRRRRSRHRRARRPATPRNRPEPLLSPRRAPNSRRQHPAGLPRRLRCPSRRHRASAPPPPAPQDRRHGQRNRHLRRHDRSQATRLDLPATGWVTNQRVRRRSSAASLAVASAAKAGLKSIPMLPCPAAASSSSVVPGPQPMSSTVEPGGSRLD
jgi:NADH-quinone oxidoreductase subunit F